jgi:hypothetical protein
LQRVIRCEALWGVAIDFSNGKHLAYEVGSRDAAELECARIELGEPPRWGPFAGQALRAQHEDLAREE